MDPGYEPCSLQKEQYFSLEQIIYYKKPLKTLNQKKKKKPPNNNIASKASNFQCSCNTL